MDSRANASRIRLTTALALAALLAAADASSQTDIRPRARDIGVAPGIFETGRDNAVTDVAGVRVGQTTVWEGESIRSGVTVIVPHSGNLYDERVPAGIHVANGYGKLLGITQLEELGELETPIALTCTLCVWQVANAMVDYLLSQPGMDEVRSINPVVGETNDGFLNNIRARPAHGRRTAGLVRPRDGAADRLDIHAPARRDRRDRGGARPNQGARNRDRRNRRR